MSNQFSFPLEVQEIGIIYLPNSKGNEMRNDNSRNNNIEVNIHEFSAAERINQILFGVFPKTK